MLNDLAKISLIYNIGRIEWQIVDFYFTAKSVVAHYLYSIGSAEVSAQRNVTHGIMHTYEIILLSN